MQVLLKGQMRPTVSEYAVRNAGRTCPSVKSLPASTQLRLLGKKHVLGGRDHCCFLSKFSTCRIPSSSFALFSQDCFSSLRSLWFHTNLRVFFFSVFVKSAIGILLGITLNLYIALDNNAILTVLILQSMNTEYLSISLCLQFLLTMPYSFQCTGPSCPLLSLFLAIVSFIVAIIDGVIFSIYLLNILLVYKNAMDFCILILNPATLLYLFIFNSFSVGIFRIF